MTTRQATGKDTIRFAERYRVVSTLGAGGMATVYLAMDERLDRLVAVKVIHAHLSDNRSLLERFKTEARTVASLHSPFIVEIHDFGVHDGSLYFVMEFIDGQTLNWIMGRLNSEPMDPDVAAALICQVAEGLAVVEKPGIVHRDLKPDNILISSQGYLKITDFGIVHLKGESNLTVTGQVLGTPRYMSPEQVRGSREITHQSDLFSLGVIFYYCLTGKLPFQGESIHQVMSAIADEPPLPLRTWLPDVDPQLEFLVKTLLQKDPGKRGAGAHWLQFELKKYLFRRQVVDPVARIKSYLGELGERGIQTVREIDWLEVEVEMKRHRERKTRMTLSRYSGFRGQVTRMLDVKSKWLWGVLLFILSITGLLGTYVAREYLRLAGNGKVAAGISEQRVEAKTRNIGQQDAESASIPGLPQPDPPRFELSVEQPPRPERASPDLNAKHPVRVTAKRPEKTEWYQKAQGNDKVSPSAMAQVSATSSPPFAEISVGDQSWGYCPLRDFSVMPGTYRLRISWRNSRSIDTTIHVREGRNRFQFNLGE